MLSYATMNYARITRTAPAPGLEPENLLLNRELLYRIELRRIGSGAGLAPDRLAYEASMFLTPPRSDPDGL